MISRVEGIFVKGLEFNQPPKDCAAELRDLHQYWTSIHPKAGLPGRQHFNPADIAHLLPRLWLVDVVGDPMRFRFRLVGTGITTFTGRDSTEKWLDEVYDDFRNTGAHRRICQCASDGKPLFQQDGEVISNPEYGTIRAERLYLPLASNGKKVDIIVIMTNYLDARPKSDSRKSSF